MTVDPGRDAVLGAVRKRRAGSAESRAEAVRRRLAAPPRGPGLSRAAEGGDLADRFAAAANAAGALALRAADPAAAIRALIRDHRIDGPAVRADLPEFAELDDLPGIHVGAADPGDRLGIGHAIAAIAETGTLVLAASPQTPVSLNFLPETHIVTVDAAAIRATPEDVWPLLRTLSPPPRAINLITGPSRTGDIELTLQIGVHGPKRLFVVVVGDV